jgi:hypothetical protein
MALVRRTAVDGRPATPTTPVTAVTVPRQPSAADIDEAAAGSPPPAAEEMAAAPDRPPRPWVVLVGLLLIAAGGAGAYLIDGVYQVPTLAVGGQATAVVGLVLFAVVVERLLVPFTRWLPGRRARNRYEQQVADFANRLPQASLAEVAVAKARVTQHRADKALLTWGLGTAVATVLAAGAGFHLPRILLDTGPQALPVWVDALATGLLVGSLTKPVHDLLNRLQHTPAPPDPTGL